MTDPKKNLETLRRFRSCDGKIVYEGGPSAHLTAIGARLIWLSRKRPERTAIGRPVAFYDDEICANMWLLACLHAASGQDPTLPIRKLKGAEEIDFSVYDDALRSVRRKQLPVATQVAAQPSRIAA